MGHGKRARNAGRDPGGFLAIPFTVLDSKAYQGLSMHARGLLLEIARQYKGGNNGSLLCSRAYMLTRGWKSSDMLMKARNELVDAGFLFQTVQGQRPNKASWYALTWLSLDRLAGYDAGAAELFKRGAYKDPPGNVVPLTTAAKQSKSSPAKTESLDRPTVQEAA